MKNQAMQFDGFLAEYEKAIVDTGLGYSSRLRMLNEAAKLIKKHEEVGLDTFDETVIEEHYQYFYQRIYDGISKEKTTKSRIHDVQKFLYFCEYGVLQPTYQVKGSTYRLVPEYQRIADAYLESGDFHPNTKNDMRWVCHKYFTWLNEHGFDDIKKIEAKELQWFLLECSKTHQLNSMRNIKLYMKKLYAYLYSVNLAASHYSELFSFRVSCESKIYPALPMSDVKKLLETINRVTKKGKRDYAAMILGAELGLRACDIISLKLSNIDWTSGEIKIKQSKTGRTVVLPLTENVGEALRDYILNARPETTAQHIFLRIRKPFTPLRCAVDVGEIYESCCKVAGFKASKSFHTLRRSLATAMVTGGIEVTTVAEVLGDAKVSSLKKYISLDSKHLKCCALPLDNIYPIAPSQGINPNDVGGDE